MIALVLEIGPRLGLVVVLVVAIVTVGGYYGAWGAGRPPDPFSFGTRDNERVVPTKAPPDAQ
jgi:hypothetical protein